MLFWTKRLLGIFPRKDKNLYWVIGLFFISRIVYFFYFRLRFDAGPLTSYWQYIDPQLLENHLLQSLYYLHSQPPLFNLFLGVILKLFPDCYPIAFHFIFMSFGLLGSISLFLVMTEIGLSSRLTLLLTSLFIISPINFEYENWLFYDYPTAALLTLSLLFLHRFALLKRTKDCFKFFLLLAVVVYFRGLLGLYWLLLVATILLAFNLREWKKIILACLLPIFLVLALYVKNFIVFNSFSISDAQIGVNLAEIVTGSLPPSIRDDLIAQKKISGLCRVKPFYSNFLEYVPYGIQIKPTGVPILDQRLKSNGWSPNAHNLIYLEVGKIDIKDASYVLKHHPVIVLENCGLILIKNYFLTSDQCCPFYKGKRSTQWKEWRDLYKKVFLGELINGKSLFLILGLPILFLYGFFLAFRSFLNKNRDVSESVVIVFMMVTIIYLIIITTFSWGEQNRYRSLVDPFYLVLFGMFIKNTVKFSNSSFRWFLLWVRGKNV